MTMRSPHGGLQSARVRAALYYARQQRLQRLTGVEVAVITATTAPFLGTLTDGDQVQDAYTAGSGYASSADGGAATIVSVVTTVTINGLTGALTDVVAFSDVVSVTVNVTDDQTPANERTFFAGSQTVASLVQPFALTLSGNTLTGTGLSLTLTGNILEAA